VNWNALKLLNARGEFISAADGEKVLRLAESEAMTYAPVEKMGAVRSEASWTKKHIDAILKLDLVDAKAIAGKKFRVVLDAVNSVGGIAVPLLLEALGVETIKLYCEPNGNFPHNPEPLPENLKDLCGEVVRSKAHLGIAVDPDVDRLALVCEDGSLFGEEYTLVACADHVLRERSGDAGSGAGMTTVSNLSSTRALDDVTARYGGKRHASAVGEVNVVEEMKRVKAGDRR
jgi:phosphomannomutase